MSEFHLEKTVQEHLTDNSKDIEELLKAIQSSYHDETVQNAQQLKELKNPDKTPIELIEGVEEMIDFKVPQIRDQSEEQLRRQLKRRTDWIPIKGIPLAFKSFMNSLGFFADTEVKLSKDYQTFLADSDVTDRFGAIPADWFYTPHVDVTFSNSELIDGKLMTQEIWDILSNQVLQVVPATAVLDWTYQIIGFAKEDVEVVNRRFVDGSSSPNFQSVNSEEYFKFNRAGDGVQALRTFQFMDTENLTEWKIGKYTGNVDDFNDFDKVVKRSEVFDLKLDQPRGRSTLTIPIGSFSDPINAIGLFGNGELRVLYKFPQLNALNNRDFDIEFVAHVEKIPPKFHKQDAIELTEDRLLNDQTENRHIFYTDEYYHDWDRDLIRTDWTFRLDHGNSLDEEGKYPFLSILRQKEGFWRAGTLSSDPSKLQVNEGNTGLPEMPNPVMDFYSFYDIYHSEGFDQITLEIDLSQSVLFDKDIQQIGIYDPNKHLIAVAQFEDPVVVEDQFERDAYKLELDVQ